MGGHSGLFSAVKKKHVGMHVTLILGHFKNQHLCGNTVDCLVAHGENWHGTGGHGWVGLCQMRWLWMMDPHWLVLTWMIDEGSQ